MREKQRLLQSLLVQYVGHEIGTKLHAASKFLYSHSELLELLEKDIQSAELKVYL